MAKPDLDVVGIGNAIVDVLAQADDQLLIKQGIAKGAMTLVDAKRAESLYAAMGPAVEVSGGSAANTIAGVASLGGKAGFIGRVKNDELGRVFAHDIRALGVHYDTAFAERGAPTARCLILVTPDAQRSMSTFLGASQDLGPEDIEPALVSRGAIVYLEGYLWDPPRAKEAFRKAIEIARRNGRKVAFSLSDPFCVDRYRHEFCALIEERAIDILFANEREIEALYEVKSFDDALQIARGKLPIAALTRSEKGSVVLAERRGPCRRRRARGARRRHDGGGRSLRRGLSLWAGAREGFQDLRPARRHLCGRSHQPHRPAARDLAQEARGGEGALSCDSLLALILRDALAALGLLRMR